LRIFVLSLKKNAKEWLQHHTHPRQDQTAYNTLKQQRQQANFAQPPAKNDEEAEQ
jgi:hypothetical protein